MRVLSYAANPDRFHEVNERFHKRSMRLAERLLFAK